MCIVAVQVKSEPVAQLEIMQLCSTNRKKRGPHPCFSQLLERCGEFVAAKGCKIMIHDNHNVNCYWLLTFLLWFFTLGYSLLKFDIF